MKAKKILAGACASLMLAITAAPVVSAADAVTVTVGNTTAEAGGKFSVTLDLADVPAAGINACDFGIKFDSKAITVTNVKAGDLAKEDTATLEGVKALETNIETGLVSVIYGLGTTDASNYITKAGTFLNIEGTVSADAAAGKYDLEVVAIDRLADPSGTASNADIIFGNYDSASGACTMYTPTITDGYVEVVSDSTEETVNTEETQPTTPEATDDTEGTLPNLSVTMRGDVTCNDMVNLDDIVALSKYLLNAKVYPLTEQGIVNGELTDDGKVNSSDASMLIEYNLGTVKEL